jgi:hypothetical protein
VIKEVCSDLISIYRRTSYLLYHFNLLETTPELFENRKIPKDGDPIKWEWYLKATMSESQEDILAKDLYKAAKDIAQKVQTKRTISAVLLQMKSSVL